MIYKPFKELNLSLLGMGAMRLPTQGENGPIDEDKALEIIVYAFEHGINYFDTALARGRRKNPSLTRSPRATPASASSRCWISR